KKKNQKKCHVQGSRRSAKPPELLVHLAHFFDGEKLVGQPGKQLRQLRQQLQVNVVEGLRSVGEHLQNARARILVKDRENHHRTHSQGAARGGIYARITLSIVTAHGHACTQAFTREA